MKNLAMILLAIWLIANGLMPILDLSFPFIDLILAVLAIAAGVLILIEQWKIRFAHNIGITLLAAWLIIGSLLAILDISFRASDMLLALLALGAGILILLKR